MAFIPSSSLVLITSKYELGFSTVYKIYDGYKNIKDLGEFYKKISEIMSFKDYVEIKKMLAFDSALEKGVNPLNIGKRGDFLDKLETDSDFKQRVGEFLFHIISSCESEDKAKLLGILYRNMANGLFDYERFRRLSLIIIRTYIGDIEFLYDHLKKENQENIITTGKAVNTLKMSYETQLILFSLYNNTLIAKELFVKTGRHYNIMKFIDEDGNEPEYLDTIHLITPEPKNENGDSLPLKYSFTEFAIDIYRYSLIEFFEKENPDI